MTIDYDGSQVMFRLATVAARRARKYARQAVQEEAARGQAMERRQRERDAAVDMITKTQAAAEGYANGIYIRAGQDPTGTWINRWELLPEAAKALRGLAAPARNDHAPEEPVAELEAGQVEFLSELGAWRNFLLHADARARDRLRTRLLETGRLAEGQIEVDLLTADLAEGILRQAHELFRWAEKVTGVPAPTTDCWIAPDEI